MIESQKTKYLYHMIFPYIIGILENDPVFVIIFVEQRSKESQILVLLLLDLWEKTVHFAKDWILAGEKKKFIGYTNNFPRNFPF